ncbi:MAG TPA: apolipoprotein N-acyltransferase [Candidatus Polarisedimenticolia bacterium]|nr:apolipoprotein N-acyltransferase [Candidatus Polarisedimenticolia bacterium]
MRRTFTLALLAGSGAASALAFPRTGMWPLILVGLAPLLAAIPSGASASLAAMGLAWGCGYFATLLSWLYRFFRQYGALDRATSFVLLALLVVYLALYPAAFALIGGRWARRFPSATALLLPSLWVILEWLRGHALSGFPWGLVGYAVTPCLPAIQIASVAGIYGVSFLVVLTNLLLAQWIRRFSVGARLWRSTDLLCVLLLAGALGWGGLVVRKSTQNAPTVSVAIVQASVPQDEKWNASSAWSIFEKHERLTEEAARARPVVVLWPESSSPYPLATPSDTDPKGFRPNRQYRERLEALARRLNIALLFGTVDYREREGKVRPLNAAALVRSDGTWGETYAKMHLVPFGEYVPLGWVLSFVDQWVKGAIGEFAPGKKPVVITAGSLRVGTTICYEMVFPELVRRFTARGATVLANLTNDAWFGTSSGPLQHFEMARVRAVENRRYLVRAANTGISAVIDPVGRVLAQSSLMQERVLQGRVSSRTGLSPYARHGDSFVILCAILAAAALAAGFRRTAGGEDGWRDE